MPATAAWLITRVLFESSFLGSSAAVCEGLDVECVVLDVLVLMLVVIRLLVVCLVRDVGVDVVLLVVGRTTIVGLVCELEEGEMAVDDSEKASEDAETEAENLREDGKAVEDPAIICED